MFCLKLNNSLCEEMYVSKLRYGLVRTKDYSFDQSDSALGRFLHVLKPSNLNHIHLYLNPSLVEVKVKTGREEGM